MTIISRRQALAGAAGLAALPAVLPLLTLGAGPAAAQIGSGQQVPGLYRYRIGGIEVTAVNDGMRTSPLPDGFVRNAPREAINAALEAAFQPKDTLSVQFNPLLINKGGKLTLIDTGNGPQSANATVGRLQANLAWAGIKPGDIETVVISHFHGDHINGLRAADGGLAFPNAEILVPEAEWAFWMDEGEMSRAPEGRKANFQNVRRVFKDLERKVNRYGWDKEIVPGLTSVDASGHSPGHTAFILADGNERLFVQSDVTHTPILFAPNPDWQVQFDMDGAKAAQTRRRIYDMLAAERLQLAGYHYPFPATGFIRKQGEGYEMVPALWRPVL